MAVFSKPLNLKLQGWKLSLTVNQMLFVLAASLILLPAYTRDGSKSDFEFSSKNGQAHELLKNDVTKCLRKSEQIVGLAQESFGAGQMEQAQKKIESILSDVNGIENKLLIVRLLILISDHFEDGLYRKDRNGDYTRNQSSTESLCDYAIYLCAWSIANSNEKGAAGALAFIKREWHPDGMYGLLFHRCELRQQHKPDNWL